MKLYLSPHWKLQVILLGHLRRHLIESAWHLILVCALLLFARPFVLWVLSWCFPQSWLLRFSSNLYWKPILTYQAWVSFPLAGLKECLSVESGVLMTSLCLYSFPTRMTFHFSNQRQRRQIHFQAVVPEHKHLIAWGMLVIALGGNIPLSKIRSYLYISVSTSQLSPAEAFIHMYGRVYTAVTFDTILDNRE